jgi:peptide/nickel transport system substrate-binding protein
MKRLIRSVVPLLVLACWFGFGSLASAAPENSSASAPLTVALSSDLVGSNPLQGFNRPQAAIYRQVYDTFTGAGKNGAATPQIAVSWKQTSSRSWTFRFRQNVHFSDGSLMTSRDVLATLDAYKKAGILGVWAPYLVSWKAVDKYTVKFGLNGPNTILPADFQTVFILPAKQLKSGVDLEKTIVPGTGPYVVQSHVHGSRWVLTRNPHYWGPKPKAKTVVLKVIPDPASRIAALKSGAADLAMFDTADQAAALRASNITVATLPTSGYYEIDVNGVHPVSPALKDARVRQAVMYAIDKPTIVKIALGGLGKPTGVVGGGFADGCTAAGDMYGHQDIAKAKALLDAAGVKHLNLTIYAAYFAEPASTAIAQVIQQQLEQAGIDSTIRVPDAGTWGTDVFTNGTNFDLNVGLRNGGADATYNLYDVAPSDLKGIALWKFIPRNRALSRQIITVKKLAPGKSRTAAMRKLCTLANQNVGRVGLATAPEFLAYRNDRVGNVTFPPLITENQELTYLSRVQVR